MTAVEKRIKRKSKWHESVDFEYLDVSGPCLKVKSRKKGVKSVNEIVSRLNQLNPEIISIDYVEATKSGYHKVSFTNKESRKLAIDQLIKYIYRDELNKFSILKKNERLREYNLDFGNGVSYEVRYLSDKK